MIIFPRCKFEDKEVGDKIVIEAEDPYVGYWMYEVKEIDKINIYCEEIYCTVNLLSL